MRVAQVNTTDIRDAIRLGCGTMSMVFNRDDGDVPRDSVGGRKSGIGDLHLRTKFALLNTDPSNLSASLHVRMPTGDAHNLQGINMYGGKLG